MPLSFWLAWKVTTRRAVIGPSLPVLGLRPGRCGLSRSWKLPKPEILISSPRSKVARIYSKKSSTSYFASILIILMTFSTRILANSALVSVIEFTSKVTKLRIIANYFLEIKWMLLHAEKSVKWDDRLCGNLFIMPINSGFHWQLFQKGYLKNGCALIWPKLIFSTMRANAVGRKPVLWLYLQPGL